MSRIGSIYNLKLLDLFEILVREIKYQKADNYAAESGDHLVAVKNIRIYPVQYMPDAAPHQYEPMTTPRFLPDKRA